MEPMAERMADAGGRSLPKLHSSAAWRHAEEEFFKTGRAADVQTALARMIDAIAVDAYRATIEPVLPQGAVMLAAGGYGKRAIVSLRHRGHPGAAGRRVALGVSARTFS